MKKEEKKVSIFNTEYVYNMLKNGATLIADEGKLRAWIHENGQLKIKINYSIYLELFNLSVFKTAKHDEDNNIFYYRS